MPYHYYLGMPRRVTRTIDGRSSAASEPPAGTVGWIDFRPPGMLMAEINCGFFALHDQTPPLGLDYLSLGSGDLRSMNVGPADAARWESITGYRPKGARLVDYVHDQLTGGASATGAAVAPLMPELQLVNGQWQQLFAIHLAGHSPIVLPHAKGKGNGHWAKVRAVREQMVRQILQDCEQPGAPRPDHWRAVWGMVCEIELGRDHLQDQSGAAKSARKALLPAELRARFGSDPSMDARPPQTSYSDNFNRANENPIGSPWTLQGADGLQLLSNGAKKRLNLGGYTWHGAYYSALSSSDQECQADIPYWNGGPVVRTRTADTSGMTGFTMSATNNYYYNTIRLTNGDATVLNQTAGISQPTSAKLKANGSTITSYQNGIQVWQGTDVNHGANLYPGLAAVMDNGGLFDNWSAADLAAPPPPGSPRMLMLGVG